MNDARSAARVQPSKGLARAGDCVTSQPGVRDGCEDTSADFLGSELRAGELKRS